LASLHSYVEMKWLYRGGQLFFGDSWRCLCQWLKEWKGKEEKTMG